MSVDRRSGCLGNTIDPQRKSRPFIIESATKNDLSGDFKEKCLDMERIYENIDFKKVDLHKNLCPHIGLKMLIGYNLFYGA